MLRNHNENKFKQIYSFIAITFAISWGTWILAPFIAIGDQVVLVFICLLGAFGPSLSAMLINWKGNEFNFGKVSRKRLIVFAVIFIIALVLLVFNGTVNLVFSLNIPYIYTIIVSVIISFIVGLIVSGKYSNNENMEVLFEKINGVKGKNLYLVVAFILFILTSMGGFLIYILLGQPIPADFNLLLIFLNTLMLYPFSLVGGPLNEEPGWRGFLTPRVQKRFSPLVTGLIIGVIWSIWHAPLHFNGLYAGGLPGFLIRFVYNIPLGILFTWYYNKSDRNLLGCILLHTSFNVDMNLFTSIPLAIELGILILIIFTLALIPIEKMWKKDTGEKIAEEDLRS